MNAKASNWLRFASTAAAATLTALSLGCDDGKGATAADAAAKSDAATDGSAADGATTDTLAVGNDGAAGSETATLSDSAADAAPDTAPDSAPAAKYATCAAVAQCIADACNPQAVGCEAKCLADAAGDATGKALPALACYSDKCAKGACKDSKDPTCADNCFKAACLPQLFTCLDDGKAGTQTCDTTKTCFDACKLGTPGAFECMSKCYNALDAKAKTAANALGACFAKQPAGKDPSQACMAESVACFVGDKAGDKPCFAMFSCSEACKKSGKDDYSCGIQCLSQTSKAGQKEFLDLLPCVGGNGPMTPECGAKFVACAEPAGTADCLGGIDLIGKCQQSGGGGGDNPTCMFEAMHAMTKEAALLLMQVSPCFGKNDPASAKTCAPLFLQCVNPSGTADCSATAGCMQACPKDDGGCMFGCLKKGSKDGAAAAWAAAQCGMANDPTNCTAEIGACYGTPSGIATCSQVLACTAACQGKPDCFSGCLKQGNAATAANAFAAASCFGKTDTKCTPNVVKCLGPVGTKTCAQLSPCLAGCVAKTGQDLFACQYACLAQGSSQGVTDFFNYGMCDQACKTQCAKDAPANCQSDCIKGKCKAESDACTAQM